MPTQDANAQPEHRTLRNGLGRHVSKRLLCGALHSGTRIRADYSSASHHHYQPFTFYTYSCYTTNPSRHIAMYAAMRSSWLLAAISATSLLPVARADCFIDEFGDERCRLSNGVRIGIAIAINSQSSSHCLSSPPLSAGDSKGRGTLASSPPSGPCITRTTRMDRAMDLRPGIIQLVTMRKVAITPMDRNIHRTPITTILLRRSHTARPRMLPRQPTMRHLQGLHLPLRRQTRPCKAPSLTNGPFCHRHELVLPSFPL
ncbi:hypothetical protein BC629DRAFT_576575 [Irpex lacteus]|nr:hypothetical protein BC629DRAFT_576575 [Irpex lacteus]